MNQSPAASSRLRVALRRRAGARVDAALTRRTPTLARAAPMRPPTALTVGALGVAGARKTMAAVAGLRVESRVENASLREAITLARRTRVGLRGGGGTPRSIHVERLTLLAVHAGCVVLAVANLSLLSYL